MRTSDQFVGLLRSRMDGSDPVSGAERHMLLLAPTKGGALTVTFFEGEEELEAAGAALDELEAGIPEFVRGRRTSVRGWEVALDEVREECLAARVAALDLQPWRMTELVYLVRDQLVAGASELDGWRGAVLLVNRQSGEARTITFWESNDALCRGEVRETQLRIRVAAEAEASVSRVDRYAVALDAMPTAV